MLKWTPRVLLAATVALGGAAALPAASASADPAPIAWTLPLEMANQIVVDATHHHVIIGDEHDGKLLVTDYEANPVRLLDVPSQGGMLLTGDRLYLSEPASSAIVAYDTATMTRVASYPLGTDVRAGRLVTVGDKIWFAYGWGRLGSLDPATSSVELFPELDGNWTAIRDLEAVGEHVVITGVGIQYGRIAILDASTGKPAVTAVRELPDATANLDAALTRDGSEVVLLGSQQTGAVRLRATDLAEVGSYAVGLFPNGVTVAADGTVVISDVNASPDGLAYFAPDGSVERVATVDSGYYFPGNRIRSFALVAGTHTAYAITSGTNANHPYAMQVFDPPAQPEVNGFLSAPSRVRPGQQFTITGNVYADRSPAGLPMEITRLADGARVGPTTVPAESFEFTDTAPAAGSVTYRLRVAGFVTETTVTTAVPQPATLTLDHNGAYYNQGTTVTFSAHLGATDVNRTVAIYADPAGTDPKRLLTSKAVDAKGNVTAALKLSRNTLVTATFAGDDFTTPASASAMVYTRASVSTAVSKNYKKKGSYFVFRKKANPVFTTTMTAYPKRKQYLVVESYSGGRWRAVKSGYYALSSAGKSTVTFTNSRKTGVNYRVRAGYLTGQSGDTVNATNYSPYLYFNFTK
ncbi:hypothetical protein GCM10010172_52480 [Paractinoplanes ferrugineus]|uniref:Uncharacterized protein n=1 Tax=Paractinoplanes ferrugineus TaxID=113564 RepID=A0A919J108_9ACTN|nr:hypothetical protein [Actinoplanes ferrugineus]GIE11933.1 hypothetical protein Afe05nite_37730 [Actinoplanes ferrugineus]